MEIKGFLKKKKTLSVVLACTVAVAVAAAALGAIPGGGGGARPGGSGGMQADTNTQVVVDTMSPFLGNIYVTSAFIGTVEPGRQVTIYPKASAEVVATYFNVGDKVEKGDILMQLDSASLESTIAQTQAALHVSEAKAQINLDQAQIDVESYYSGIEEGYNSSLIAAEASVQTEENNVQSANSNLWNARKTYREAKSGESGDYTDYEIDQLKNQVTQYEYALEGAQLKLELAEANLEATKKSVSEQESTINNSAAQAALNADFTDQYLALEQLRKNLSDYSITSPISGIVEQRNADQYDMASTQNPVYVISNKDAMSVSFNVSESSLAYMQVGDSITVEKNGESAAGCITEISTMVDSSSGLFTVKANVENAPFDLYSGSTVKIYADTQKAENDMMILIDAVYYDSGSPYVYIYENAAAVKTWVETGISDDSYIQIISGLTLSDRVISTWSSGLADGAEVVLVGSGEEASVEPPSFEPEGDAA